MPTRRPPSDDDLARVRRAVARLRTGIFALVCGLVAGTGLWLATAWLVVRGGDPVGPHLGLLGIYYPGYTVTWAGAFVGLGYGFLTGAAVGGAIGWLYNRLVAWRH